MARPITDEDRRQLAELAARPRYSVDTQLTAAEARAMARVGFHRARLLRRARNREART